MDLDSNRKLIATALAAVAGGDRNALQTIYRLTAAKLFAVCVRILGERGEAEDVVQEVFMTVWRRAASFDPAMSSPMTWLIAVARNRAIDHIRRRGQNRRMEPIEDAAELVDETPAADAALQDAQDRAALHRCIEGLASREQAALRGAFFDGSNYEELAARMSMPLGTMKSLIRRAMIKLKACLEAMTGADDNGFSADELLAAEYALGVLAGPEREAAARRVAGDRSFAALVAAWEQRLTPWAGELAELTPPPQVWDRIAAQLSATAPPRRPSIWQSLTFWRGFGIASALAVASLAVLLYAGTFSQPGALVASIESNGQRMFVATVDIKRGTIAVVPASFAPDPMRVPELWLIPPGGKPLPVGVLPPAGRTAKLAIPEALRRQTRSDAVLAVSLEPPGGSRTGAPTGPVIGSGKLTNL